ncbi:hypothetical protein T492DRAFT_85484 [Pavlovales sp. CCMP2436]|nr:hypothetical protein T492DRAFT_85484 [Pavlovales sp. CCMP2436]
MISAFDFFVTVPLLVSSFFAAFRVNLLQRQQTQAVRRVRQYVLLIAAHGTQAQHAAAAAARAAALWPADAGCGGRHAQPPAVHVALSSPLPAAGEFGLPSSAYGQSAALALGASRVRGSSRYSSYGAGLDGLGASAAGLSERGQADEGMHADAIALYRAYAAFLEATVEAMAHEERDASVAGVPVGPATMRIVLVLGAAGFFAALYYLSLHTVGRNLN